MQRLKFSTEVVNKSWIIRLGGFVGAANAGSLREKLMRAADASGSVVLLDLSGVREMDSAGVAVLIELHQRLRKDHKLMALVAESESARQVLELLRAHDVVCDVFSTLEEGIKKTSKLRVAGIPPTPSKS